MKLISLYKCVLSNDTKATKFAITNTKRYVPVVTQQKLVGLQDVLKTSLRHVLKTSSTSLQRNKFSSSKTSSRRLGDISQDILKTSWRCLGRRKIVTLKTSWRRLEDMSWRCFEDVLETKTMFTEDICI